MARSSLFARVHRIARGPARSGPSRRDVLKSLVGTAALLPLVGAAGCGDNSGGNTIAVIGGGIAGMTCAHFLGLAGVHAEIYEASMRIGGRQFTSRGQLADDQICELGGELVDSDHAVIPMLVESYGLTLDDLVDATPGLAQDSFFFDGALVSDAALAAAFAPVAAQMQTALTAMANDDAEYARIDALSIPEWLAGDARLVPTDLVRRVLELAYLEEFGLEVEQPSAWNLITLIDSATTEPFHVFGDSDERFHIHERSDAIATAMATELGDQVHLDHALTKVTEAEGMFELTFVTSAGTSTTTVAHVVYALPFTKLREVDLAGSALTAGKRTIIGELGYGTNAKLMLQFQTRPWETNQQSAGSMITDVGALQTTWASSRGQAGTKGVLTNFVGGERGLAIGDGSTEIQAATVLPWIETIFPGATTEYIASSAIRQHWPSYEFTKGSYASYLKGQWSFLGLEGAHEGNQHFCGEHCSEDFQGYMEGGAETGALVAAEILDDLHIDPPAALAAIVTVLTAAKRRPRGSYHAGFGQQLRANQVRRHR